MTTTAPNGTTKRHATPDIPYFVSHDSFEAPRAERLYGPAEGDDQAYAATHMPDDVTRDCVRRMHYAAWRLSRARPTSAAAPTGGVSTSGSATGWCWATAS